MATKKDPYERASRRILSALIEAEAIELVTDRGLIPLSRALASYLLGIEELDGRGSLVADWLVDHIEVADLWADDAQLDALLSTHWDTDTEPDEPLAMSRPSPELEAQLLAASNDDDPAWLVYSDWLQSRGELLGELGALQAAMRTRDRAASKRAQRRVVAFLRHHREALLGVVGEYHRIVRLEWGIGTLRAARISTTRYGDKQFHGAILLGALLERPVARYLRELWLGPIDQSGADQYAEMVAVLFERERPALRELAIGTADLDGAKHGIIRNPRAALGDLRGLDQRLPQLRALRLSGGSVELSALASPTLEQLTLELHHVTDANAEALARSSLPSLRSLSVAVRSHDAFVDALAQLLDADRVPALEQLELGVGDSERLRGVLSALAPPPRLRELVVVRSTLTDDAITWLARRQLGLHRLELRECEISDTGLEIAENIAAELVTT